MNFIFFYFSKCLPYLFSFAKKFLGICRFPLFNHKMSYFQINKEFLERELKKTHPFDGPAPRKQFPGAHPLKNMPQWLITEKKKTRIGQGRINEIFEEYR